MHHLQMNGLVDHSHMPLAAQRSRVESIPLSPSPLSTSHRVNRSRTILTSFCAQLWNGNMLPEDEQTRSRAIPLRKSCGDTPIERCSPRVSRYGASLFFFFFYALHGTFRYELEAIGHQ